MGSLDEAVDVALDSGDLRNLLLWHHVVMDESHAPVERHGDCHPALGHRVHVGRDDRDLKR